MGPVGLTNNKDYYASAGYASGNFLGLTGNKNQTVNPVKENTEGISGGINSAKVEGNHWPVQPASIAERVAQHDGGSLTQPEHRSFIPGYSNGIGENLYELY